MTAMRLFLPKKQIKNKMKRVLALILCLALLFMAACTSKTSDPIKTPQNKEGEQTDEVIEKELLTPETVIEELCKLSTFDHTLGTPGCNEVYNDQINPSEPVVKSYRLYDNYTGENVQIICFTREEDAKAASETYNGFDHTNRFGAMYLFGSSACINALSLSDYEYPDSFKAEGESDPDPASVEGIVKSIEDATELCGGYYNPQTIAQTREKIAQGIALEGDILNLVHLTYHDGSVLRFVYIYEFESENDAVLYAENRALFAQSIEDGLCVRIENKVIYGNHGIISEITG